MRRTLLMLPFSAEGSERLASSPRAQLISSSTHSTPRCSLSSAKGRVTQGSRSQCIFDRGETHILQSFSLDPPRSPTRASCTCPGTASRTSSVWHVLGPLMSRKPAKHSQSRTRTTEAAAQGRPNCLQDAESERVGCQLISPLGAWKRPRQEQNAPQTSKKLRHSSSEVVRGRLVTNRTWMRLTRCVGSSAVLIDVLAGAGGGSIAPNRDASGPVGGGGSPAPPPPEPRAA